MGNFISNFDWNVYSIPPHAKTASNKETPVYVFGVSDFVTVNGSVALPYVTRQTYGPSCLSADTNKRFTNCVVSFRYLKYLGSCDRASWAKYEERNTNKMQQLDVYY